MDLKVPRPIGGSRQSPGVGKIFVKFDNTESATKALQALAGASSPTGPSSPRTSQRLVEDLISAVRWPPG